MRELWHVSCHQIGADHLHRALHHLFECCFRAKDVSVGFDTEGVLLLEERDGLHFADESAEAFFDPVSSTISYVVQDPASNACAVVDSVLDLDYASGRIKTLGESGTTEREG